MTAEVLKFQRNGTPAVLLENLADIANEIDFMPVVRVMKDGQIRHDWSAISNSLTALGAAETLKDAMLKACD